MDVNSAEWSQKEFIILAEFCNSLKEESKMCKKTQFACKDYLCPIVKVGTSMKDIRKKFEQQQAQD